MVARSSNDGKAWKCRCGTVNFPTKHRMFNLPAFQCKNCRKKLALDFKFCLGDIEVKGKSLLGEVCDQDKEPYCVAFAYAKAAEMTERGLSIRNGTDPDLVIPINPSILEKRYAEKFKDILLGDSVPKNLGIHKVLHMGLILRSEGVERIDVRSTTKPEVQPDNVEPYKIGDVSTIPSDSFEEICRTLAEGTPLVGTYLVGKRRSHLPYCKIYKSPSRASIRAKKSKEIGHAVVLVGAGMKRGKKYFYVLNSWGKKFCPRKNKRGELISGGIGKLRAEDLTKNLIKLSPEDQTGGERRLQDQSEFKISRINYILMMGKENQCKAMKLQKLRVEANSKYVPADHIEDDIFRDDEGGSQVELEGPVENIGAKLVRQAAAKTNDLVGDGTTTSMVLAQGLIAEGVKVVAAGANPVQITRDIEKTAKALVEGLHKLSKHVEDSELADVAAISAGNNSEIGNMIAEAMSKVGQKGVVTLEEGRSSENFLYVVDEMQFDRGRISPYFVTDSEKMSAEYENCKLLLVDKKITNARDLINVLEEAIRGAYPILIIAEDIEQEALATLVVNKLRGSFKIAAIKAPGFGEHKTQYLDGIAILTGATVIRDQVWLSLDKADKSVLGIAAKVVLTKESTTIAGDGSTQEEVTKRVAQIENLIEAAEQEYEKEKLNERIAKLAGGVAVIQVGAQTETQLKEKKLRVEDALNATKAAVEEGNVVGGGCTLLRLAAKVDVIKDTFENNEQKVGAEIVRRALSYPLKLIAKNAGVNGSVVTEKVLCNDNFKYGYNAATGQDEDLMAAGIIDPTKVVRCCLEHAASVAKTFLTSDVVVDIKKPEAAPLTNPMDNSGYGY